MNCLSPRKSAPSKRSLRRGAFFGSAQDRPSFVKVTEEWSAGTCFNNGYQAPRAPARRRALALFALVTVALLVLLLPQAAGAQAAVERSDPQPNTVLVTSPNEIRIWFTGPVAVTEDGIRLFDRTGHEIPGLTIQPGADSSSVVAALPGPLPNDTYTVAWRGRSLADGQPAQGYFPFTVGSTTSIAPMSVPIADQGSDGARWWQAVAHWLVLLALTVAVAIWPVWLLVLWPATRGDAPAVRELSLRARKLGTGAVIAALVANVVALIAQAAHAQSGSLASSLGDTLAETRYGGLWLARMGLLLLIGMAWQFLPWVDPLRRRLATAAGVVIAALLPVPVSLNAHASALVQGRTSALVFDYVHLISASLWFGGLTLLAGVLLRALHTQIDRRAVLARALPRFSAMALVCWGLLAITGLYAWWLQAGSRDALRQTAYGQALLIKLLLAGAVLLIAAASLLLVTRKLARTDPGTQPQWFGRLGYAVIAELVLTTLILLAAGRLTSLPPGRDVLAAERAGQTIPFDLNGRPASLQLSPGAAGSNHFLVVIPGDPLPDGSEVRVRLTFLGEQIGSAELTLGRSTLHAFESHGSELGITGAWQIELLARHTGDFEWSDTRPVDIAATSATAAKPPWRFGAGGIVGLLLCAIGLIGFALAWRSRDRMRMESAGLGAVAMALGLVLMAQGRIQPVTGFNTGETNPVAATTDSIARGNALFQANCASCHGATGLGDGPSSPGMFPKPADFSAAHTKVHPDGQFFDWIENGKTGTEMPAFGAALTDAQIWDLINYIQVAIQGKPAAQGTPSPAEGA